ncbi:type I-E CRISPR-associated protein Cse2/CasB [Deinococcus planocerae]|uniref:type I-E CRISPR-associated protein Cse2/CasB n=1 Tax=Deinococcus planocerae TaxID=1737569 RepID=UPI000C7F29D1|nr:type I-E CRISPR-associated protein Cse2/CasB [Deinococcus planocerae]
MTQAPAPPARLERETAFFEGLSHLERGRLAELRRGASLEPDQRPYFLERLLLEHLPNWQGWAREAAYLVASLYALVERPSADGTPGETEDTQDAAANPAACPRRASLGRDLGKLYRDQDERPSTEKRFLSLLDADEAQFPYQLRQVVTLLNASDIRPSWPHLLSDARAWGHPDAREAIRDRWAQDFYRASKSAATDPADPAPTTPEEPR